MKMLVFSVNILLCRLKKGFVFSGVTFLEATPEEKKKYAYYLNYTNNMPDLDHDF